MNEKLKTFARQALGEGLAKLSDAQQVIFKLMYGRREGRRDVEASKAMPIADVINEIPDERLDWAMQQVENSLAAAGSPPPQEKPPGE